MNKILTALSFLLTAFACINASVIDDIEEQHIASYLDGTPVMKMDLDAYHADNAPVQYLNDDIIDYTVSHSNPCIIDFFAEWCPPCKKLGPVYERVANDMKSKISFYKLNIDGNDASCEKYKIELIPTLIIFKDGKEVARRIGFADDATLKTFIESNLK